MTAAADGAPAGGRGRLRILHVSTRLIVGGSQENTVLSCEGQAALGHEVHLAFGPQAGPEGSMLDRVRGFRTEAGARIATHTCRRLVREVRPLGDALALRELAGLIERLRPDVVHTHSSKAGILGRAAAWRARCGPAVVHTIHGPPFMPAAGGALSRLRTRAANAAYAQAERLAASRCDVIVSVADAMTAGFLARGVGRPEQYVTVRSGVELEPYNDPAPTRASVRAGLGLGAGDFVVGTIARLAPNKGHDDLLDALAEPMREHPHWKLLWVGDGPLGGRLRGRVEAMGLSGRVVMAGLVEPARICGLLRAMDVLAHPSRREGLPRTVTQALLAGVCPVAYDCDGTPEVCQHERTGLLVPTGDLRALRQAIVSLAQDSALRLRLAAAGRDMAVRDYDAAGMVRALEGVYARALAARDARRPAGKTTAAGGA